MFYKIQKIRNDSVILIAFLYFLRVIFISFSQPFKGLLGSNFQKSEDQSIKF